MKSSNLLPLHTHFLTDEVLAERLLKIIAEPRRWTKADRDALVAEAAYRLSGEAAADAKNAASEREQFNKAIAAHPLIASVNWIDADNSDGSVQS